MDKNIEKKSNSTADSTIGDNRANLYRWTNRDWHWILGIMTGIIILLVIIIFTDIPNISSYFAFGANAVSITLAVVAIFFSFTESRHASEQNTSVQIALKEISEKVVLFSDIRNEIILLKRDIGGLDSQFKM